MVLFMVIFVGGCVSLNKSFEEMHLCDDELESFIQTNNYTCSNYVEYFTRASIGHCCTICYSYNVNGSDSTFEVCKFDK